MSSVIQNRPQAWQALLETLQFAQKQVEDWMLGGALSVDVGQEMLAKLKAQHSRFTAQSATDSSQFAHVLGFIPLTEHESPEICAFRQWKFLETAVREQKQSNRRLALSQFHAIEREITERLATLSRKLSAVGIRAPQLAATAIMPAVLVDDDIDDTQFNASQSAGPQVSPQAAQSASSQSKPKSSDHPRSNHPQRRNLLELLLDPQSIQWLLGLGGALMVVGLVILLWVNEFFTPAVMAVGLGVINVAVYAAGFWCIRGTRFQMAGKALTLLSCLVMPLNLWYYSSNSLITLDGHLWVAAVVISALYAAAAVLLKDEMFVYVLMAGVAMTGLLMLADLPPSPQKFWEIPYPATLLVVLGLIAIHAERAFASGAGPFTRDRFGLAFFWSGQVLLGVGLALVLGAQITGDWLYEPWFKPVLDRWQASPSPICGELRWLALLLVGLATYTYVYSDLVVRRQGIYINIAACTLLWAEVLAVQLLDLDIGADALIAVLALTSLVVHVIQANLQIGNSVTRTFPMLGLLLGLLPVLLGSFIYLQNVGIRSNWINQPPRWSFVGAMLLAALASRSGAHIYRNTSPKMAVYYFFATGAALTLAAATALAALGGQRWEVHAPILMLIPIAYLIAAFLYGPRVQGRPALWVAHVGAVVMLASSLFSTLLGFSPNASRGLLNLSLALFFAEGAVFYGLATAFQKQPRYVYWATLMAGASCWQLLSYWSISTQGYLLVFAVVGLVLQAGYRLAYWEKTPVAPLAEALYQASNTLLSLAFVSSVFYAMFRILANTSGHGGLDGANIDWGFTGYCLAMLIVSLAAFAMTRQPAWRSWYLVTTLGQGAMLLLAVHKLIDLTPWQQFELFSVLVGVFLLVVGHIGWYRERDRESDLVSSSLLLGAILSTAPLALATWIDRYHNQFLVVNEFGFLFLSVLLLATGVVLKLKSTTIVGGTMTGLYFATLLIFVPWSQLNSVAIAITAGGCLIFGLGLVLAFFRDQILELPGRIKERKGIFRVLNWR